ncbi:sodium:solute symporter family transporter [Flavivirga rizhaonensis]|uniref:Sodium/glucose cotransporter n=1 Tax=Flavivirga rizhaonensis TaxID=2559571 RepID=A0A4S1DWC5_9FLAO|nr:sodium/solute symporter [Flavivirga rizhaonensis]TGV02436.1 sodium/glucose cotransporter [Flavivirga rizhaonensis]
MFLSNLDLIVLFVYLFGIIGYGLWMSRAKYKNASDYFLASKSLPWWIVGGSLIASNISAEQILGTNGSGYAIGLAIGGYELMSALTLILVAKYLLPVFLEKKIYSIPQFLKNRFDNRVRICFSFILIILYVFVNISSIFYLGGLAIENLTGLPILIGVLGLVIYSASFSIFGGLKAVVWTDVIQAVVLLIGGLFAAGAALYTLGHGNIFDGLSNLYKFAPERFDMILDKSHEHFSSVPGISVLVGGMWITNLYYWGGNQFIIQRALAAKNIKEAQKGVASAALLKILIPIIAVIPGMTAYALHADIGKPDEAFPWVLSQLVPIGVKGLVFAALVAAIGSSISSLVNSVSTITTLDLYKPIFNKKASEKHLVKVGKITAAAALLVGMLAAPLLSMLELDQAFQFIQEFTGFISPGAFVAIIFGMFWKRTSAKAALWVALLCVPLSIGLFLMTDLPFFYRMTISFVVLSTLIVSLSYLDKPYSVDKKIDSKSALVILGTMLLTSIPFVLRIFTNDIILPPWVGTLLLFMNVVCLYFVFSNKTNNRKAIVLGPQIFKTEKSFNMIAYIILIILSAIYGFLW